MLVGCKLANSITLCISYLLSPLFTGSRLHSWKPVKLLEHVEPVGELGGGSHLKVSCVPLGMSLCRGIPSRSSGWGLEPSRATCGLVPRLCWLKLGLGVVCTLLSVAVWWKSHSLPKETSEIVSKLYLLVVDWTFFFFSKNAVSLAGWEDGFAAGFEPMGSKFQGVLGCCSITDKPFALWVLLVPTAFL